MSGFLRAKAIERMLAAFTQIASFPGKNKPATLKDALGYLAMIEALVGSVAREVEAENFAWVGDDKGKAICSKVSSRLPT